MAFRSQLIIIFNMHLLSWETLKHQNGPDSPCPPCRYEKRRCSSTDKPTDPRHTEYQNWEYLMLQDSYRSLFCGQILPRVSQLPKQALVYLLLNQSCLETADTPGTPWFQLTLSGHHFLLRLTRYKGTS